MPEIEEPRGITLGKLAYMDTLCGKIPKTTSKSRIALGAIFPEFYRNAPLRQVKTKKSGVITIDFFAFLVILSVYIHNIMVPLQTVYNDSRTVNTTICN